MSENLTARYDSPGVLRACLWLAMGAGAAGILTGLLLLLFPRFDGGHHPAPLIFLSAGAALFLSLREPLTPWRGMAVRVLGASVGLIGFFAWMGLLGRFHSPGARSAAFEAALTFLGVAVMAVDIRILGKSFLSQILILLSVTICLLALLGRAFGVESPYFFSSGMNAPLVPTVAVILIGAGLVCARPRVGCMEVVTSAGTPGRMARWLLLGAVSLPICVSWLKVEAVRHGFSGAGLGPITCLGFILLLTIMVLLSANSVLGAEKRREEMEAALERARVELEVLLREKTNSLSVSEGERVNLQAQLVAAQRLEALGRLAGGVAHDFNNLLTAISGFSELLMGTFSDDDPRRDDLGEIQKAGQRASRLTQQLLAFSRRQVLEPKVIKINELIADLQKMLKRLIGDDIELIFVAGEELPEIYADPGQVEQVILNFVVNSKDAMPRGGKITISTSVEDMDASFTKTYSAGPHVVISVADTGCGMDDYTMAHMFDPFFTTKERGKGTGLGLSTVFGIVKQSGGTVLAESWPGKGSVFRVYLPAVKGAPVAAHGVRIPSPSVGGSGTILVVDDDDSVRKPIVRYLSQIGYTVLEAASADVALRLSWAQTRPIRLLLCDVVMPGMNGYELARGLVSTRPNMKVIMMSGYTGESAIKSENMPKNFSFLQKPVMLNNLRDCIQQQLADFPTSQQP